MSIHDIPVAETVERRLRNLLKVARRVKPESTIEPALQPSSFQTDVAFIAVIKDSPPSIPGPSDAAANVNDAEQQESAEPQPSTTKPSHHTPPPHHAALETAARDIFYSLLATHAIDKPDFANVWNLLDILQFCADAGQCDPSLPLWLIEELLDSQTIDGCRRVFDYLESRREILISRAAGANNSNNKKMIVLRSCNELLRRLSRAEDAVFCGRVFVFLFGSFPLGDKSSVNLRGEFHTENTTVFDEVGEKADTEGADADGDEAMDAGEDAAETDKAGDADGGDQMEVDTNAKGDEATGAQEVEKTDAQKPDEDTKKAPADETLKITKAVDSSNLEEAEMDTDKLYTAFWSLQHVFSNPTTIFNQANFDEFKRGLEVTVKKFKSTPKVLQTHGTPRAASESMRGLKRRRSRADDEFASNFNPKYLTSRDLFELEMSDLTFQRHILVQSLILIDFLLSLTPKAKKRLAELKAQRALLYNFTLSEEDATWATNTRATIASYLQEGPEGKFYYRMADTVLARDKNWVRWKVESCPPIEKPPTATQDYVEALNGAKRACTNRRIKANLMGAVELGFLSDAENVNGLDKLRDPARYTAPSMDKYLKEIDGVDLDLEMATEEEKPYLVETRASSTWRVLRLASKSRLNMFDQIDESQGFKALVQTDEIDKGDEAALAEEEEAAETPDATTTTADVKMDVKATDEEARPTKDESRADTPVLVAEAAGVEDEGEGVVK